MIVGSSPLPTLTTQRNITRSLLPSINPLHISREGLVKTIMRLLVLGIYFPFPGLSVEPLDTFPLSTGMKGNAFWNGSTATPGQQSLLFPVSPGEQGARGGHPWTQECSSSKISPRVTGLNIGSAGGSPNGFQESTM